MLNCANTRLTGKSETVINQYEQSLKRQEELSKEYAEVTQELTHTVTQLEHQVKTLKLQLSQQEQTNSLLNEHLQLAKLKQTDSTQFLKYQLQEAERQRDALSKQVQSLTLDTQPGKATQALEQQVAALQCKTELHEARIRGLEGENCRISQELQTAVYSNAVLRADTTPDLCRDSRKVRQAHSRLASDGDFEFQFETQGSPGQSATPMTPQQTILGGARTVNKRQSTNMSCDLDSKENRSKWKHSMKINAVQHIKEKCFVPLRRSEKRAKPK